MWSSGGEHEKFLLIIYLFSDCKSTYVSIVENCKVQKYIKKETEYFFRPSIAYLKVLDFFSFLYYVSGYNTLKVSQTFLLP